MLWRKSIPLPKKDSLTQKVFTIRLPQYIKTISPEITQAEKDINTLLNRNDIESTANPDEHEKPLIVFIHGFAASKYCWLDPDIGNMGWVKDYQNDPPPLDYGWHAIPPPPFVPVEWSLSNQVIPVGATQIMDNHHIEWLTYSQKSAFGDIEISVKELQNILYGLQKIYGQRKIIIIAHSRGGLISKRYLDISNQTSVIKLVTFGSPFGGTFMSSLEMFRLPSKHFLNKIRTVKKLWDVSQERRVESIATKQMAPESTFLQSLIKAGCKQDVEYVNVAGSCSLITNVYAWHWSVSSWKRKMYQAIDKKKEREKLQKINRPPIDWFNLPKYPIIQAHNWILEPYRLFEIYPKVGYPEVLQGDGAVFIKSALLDFPEIKQYIIHKNHIDMTCCTEGYDIMLKEIQLCQKNI